MVTFTVLENLSMKILDPLILMILPWDNDKSSDNGIFAEKGSDSEQIQSYAVCHALR